VSSWLESATRVKGAPRGRGPVQVVTVEAVVTAVGPRQVVEDDTCVASHVRAALAPYLVVSEVSWFSPDPPQEVCEFWNENYPAIRSVDENLAAARERGWLPVSHFHLPKEGWVQEYYGQLEERLTGFRQANTDDPDALAVADLTEVEMSMYSQYSDFYGYEFFVFRRTE